ncbi:MAG: glycosyltransferase family 39 protein [Chloroflexi bacterium]|nr:glycosyltransferase family 39 protein [Chloroflexota bacterium]
MIRRLTSCQTILSAILLLYVGLAISYAQATPVLESSDEYKHYPFVQYVQTAAQLPVLDPENPGLWLQEAAQPPLYYLLMAAITAPIATDDLPDLHRKNEHAFIGNPNQVSNKNLILHDPVREAFPWQGSVLAIHLIRLASIALGVGTLLTTAVLLRRLFSPTITLLGVALTAFNPMFLFISAAVNNDSLAALLGHVGLLLLLIVWQTAPAVRSGWWRYGLLGLVIGLGALTKLSLAGLLVLTAVALFWLARRQRDWTLFWLGGPLVLGSSLLAAGWWLLRNWRIYGDLTGLNAFIAVQGTRDTPLTLAGWLDEFGTFYRSFWGLFGGVNVAAPNGFYFLLNVLALVALAGLIRWLWPAENRRQFVANGGWLLAAWIGVLFLLLLRWNIISTAFQGRLLFPALGAINGLLALGLLAWFKPRAGQRLALAVGGGLFLAAALLPWWVIRPAYALPEVVTAVPASAAIDPIRFTAPDGELRLVGVEMAAGQSATPGGGPIVAVLYWQAAEPVAADYVSSVHLLGRDFASVGQIDRYPASGTIATSRWQAGDIYRDVYHVYVGHTAVAPSQLRLAVSLYDTDAAQPLPASSLNGQPINPVLVGGTARLTAATSMPEPATRLNVPFADGVTLVGYTWGAETAVAGQPIALTLFWQADGAPTQNYTVFVHLLDANRQWLVGADAPPLNNFYPTHLWQAGDWLDDTHHLLLPADLPAGQYAVLIGLYEPQSGARLLRLDGAGDFVEIELTVGE